MDSKRLSFFNVFQITILSTIGAGILTSTHTLQDFVKRPSSVISLWLVTGGLTLLQALCYADLANIVGGGGDSAYLSAAFLPHLGTVYNLFSCLVVLPCSCAISISRISEAFSPDSSLVKCTVALATFIIFACPRRIRKAVISLFFFLNVFFIAVIVVSLLLCPAVSDSVLKEKVLAYPTLSQYTSAIIVASFFFAGFNSCNYMPTESLPSLYVPYSIAVAVITAIYTVISYNIMAVCNSKMLADDLFIRNVFVSVVQHFNLGVPHKYASMYGEVIFYTLHFGPVLGTHLTLGSILHSLLPDKPASTKFKLLGGYIMYFVIIIVMLLTSTAEKILNYVSIAITLFYTLTLVAYMKIKLRSDNKRNLPIIIPLLTLLCSISLFLCRLFNKL